MPNPTRRIVIVGGGFAGSTLAQRVERLLPIDVEVVVISADNHMVFTPMLPEVVGRTVSPLDVVVPDRQMTKRTKWLQATVNQIDLVKNEVEYVLKDGAALSIGYDDLILACGSAVNLDEIPGLASRGYPLKTVMDAIAMGNDLIGSYEAAATERDNAVRQRLLTVVVIGGGFSGVEVAGHICDLMQAVRRFYPELKAIPPRVVLLQKSGSLLPELDKESLSGFTLKKLSQNGIEVRLNTEAQKVDSEAVYLNTGETIGSGMVVCTVGTQTHPLITGLGLQLERGRLKTDPDMKVTGTANLWAIGDCSVIENAFDGKASPATAQFAMQQSDQLAKNLQRASKGEPTHPFSFRPRGMLASIGHRNGVAIVYGVKLSGFIAWILWRGVYLTKLPTLNRKLEVAIGWLCSLAFPPNIVQLRLAKGQPPDGRNQSATQKAD